MNKRFGIAFLTVSLGLFSASVGRADDKAAPAAKPAAAPAAKPAEKAAPAADKAAPAGKAAPAADKAAPAEDKALGKQQNKMVDCNKEATTKALKGDARSKFMAECLKAKPEAEAAKPAAPPAADKAAPAADKAAPAADKGAAAPKGNKQQNKMAECNKEATAKALKADARKAFMKECLSAKAAP